jgi:glucoamylase
MARTLPVGNGALLVTFEAVARMRDIAFPHLDQENHTVGHPCRFGFCVDGHFTWVGPTWQHGSTTLATP